MSTMLTFVAVFQVLSALAIIGLVLLQHGKGADMGAAFGSGASGSLFGASGSSNFLSKATAFAALVFFCATLALALFGNQANPGGGVMDRLAPQAPAAAPAASAPAAPAADGAKAGAEAPAGAAAPAGGGQANQIPK